MNADTCRAVMRTALAAFVFVWAGLPSVVQAQPSTVILVRHAERAPEPPRDPVLSDAGIRRSHDLAAALRYAGVTAIVSTQFQRTRLTAVPLAAALGIEPRIIMAGGGATSHADSVASVVRAHGPGEVVLVVGHSNTIPAIVAALGGPRFPDYCENQYSDLVVMQLGGGATPRVIRAHYGAPDSPQSSECNRTMR